ncbi:MAG: transcriptional regulator, MarR family [Bacteroidetes bacterium]|jgi:DNA-binding MarR family transcriptional regulator|nr:transcriptional regulator, MarR family [Bacteroidota bacterium]
MSENAQISIDKIVENLISIHPLLSKNFTRAIRSKTNLNPGSLFILGLLKKYTVLSMTEIGCKLSMPKPHVTAQIDKLIAEEMVERLNDPNDRRIINIRLTDNGLKDFESIKLEITEELRHRIEKLSTEKIERLYAASAVAREILTEIMIEPSTPGNDCKR